MATVTMMPHCAHLAGLIGLAEQDLPARTDGVCAVPLARRAFPPRPGPAVVKVKLPEMRYWSCSAAADDGVEHLGWPRWWRPRPTDGRGPRHAQLYDRPRKSVATLWRGSQLRPRRMVCMGDGVVITVALRWRGTTAVGIVRPLILWRTPSPPSPAKFELLNLRELPNGPGL
jgi:hypothetical protein